MPPGQWSPGPGGGYGYHAYPGSAPYAGYAARLGGYLLDALIIGVVAVVILVPTHAFRHSQTLVNGHTQYNFHVSGAAYIVFILLAALYPALMIGLRGQTVGMMAARTKAIDATTGNLIGFWRALGRDLFERLLGFLLFVPVIIDLLFPLWDPRNQTLHDKVTNTVVIRV